MRSVAGFILLFFATMGAFSQQAPGAASTSIRFTYQNLKLSPSDYQVYIREDGTGRYTASDGGAHPTQQEISVTPELLATMFATARQQKFFDLACEAKGADHVAFQGNKTLAYDGPDGKGTCTFNYSKIKQIEQLNDTFQSIASTVAWGQRMVADRQHDRLGLDKELEGLTSAAADGRAIQLQNIRSILQEIAADPSVINRARQRAALLASGKTH
jgi:hypothetical protein